VTTTPCKRFALGPSPKPLYVMDSALPSSISSSRNSCLLASASLRSLDQFLVLHYLSWLSFFFVRHLSHDLSFLSPFGPNESLVTIHLSCNPFLLCLRITRYSRLYPTFDAGKTAPFIPVPSPVRFSLSLSLSLSLSPSCRSFNQGCPTLQNHASLEQTFRITLRVCS
jgi:hypothetical protein